MWYDTANGQPTAVIGPLSPQQSLSKYIVTEVKALTPNEFNSYVVENFGEFDKIFTDGSLVTFPDKSVGAAVFVSRRATVTTWKLEPRHSVIGAELFAVYQALQFVDMNKIASAGHIF